MADLLNEDRIRKMIAAVSKNACRSLGYTREELLQLYLWDIDPVYPKELWDTQWLEFQQACL
jgi:PAS domain-containing protein